MRETLQPIPGPGMTARQRGLLQQHPGLEMEEQDLPETRNEEKDSMTFRTFSELDGTMLDLWSNYIKLNSIRDLHQGSICLDLDEKMICFDPINKNMSFNQHVAKEARCLATDSHHGVWLSAVRIGLRKVLG